MTEWLWLMLSAPSGRVVDLGQDASLVLTAKLPAGGRSLNKPDKVQDQEHERGRQHVPRNSARSGWMGENYHKSDEGKDHAERNVGQ